MVIFSPYLCIQGGEAVLSARPGWFNWQDTLGAEQVEGRTGLAATGVRRALSGTHFFESCPEMVTQRAGTMSGYVRGRFLCVYGQIQAGLSLSSEAAVAHKM